MIVKLSKRQSSYDFFADFAGKSMGGAKKTILQALRKALLSTNLF